MQIILKNNDGAWFIKINFLVYENIFPKNKHYVDKNKRAQIIIGCTSLLLSKNQQKLYE